MMRGDFKKLLVWQQAHRLTLEVYRLTLNFPPYEAHCLSLQIRRAVVSIESNIAEGNGRDTNKDYLRFLYVSRGSLYEVETQLLIAKDLGYITDDEYEVVDSQRISVLKLLNLLIKKIP